MIFVLAIIVVVSIFVLIIFMIVLAVRKYIRFRHSIVSNEDLIEEISDLQRQVVKMTKEKMRDRGNEGGSRSMTTPLLQRVKQSCRGRADACTGRSSNHC